ncbi:hypothetical protein IFT48_04605 [Pseudomonas fluorescens]|uniref:hypothetical protein n=1 Tax=Pseudomonas TaxID=286 RepID=UPI000F039ABB|nr:MULTISPECIES: hypothetical protein [Pseudomonas]MBD8089254.1 hypothetical protein [Pseudomonas fluorescens]MBD8615319.1 hypothetical protein [Pseudomonas putida]MBD8682027.1 hypothetical protein [Pseudomonas sp. CFBP 13719]
MSSLALSSFPAYPYTVEEVVSPDANYAGRNDRLDHVKQALRGMNRYFDAFCRERQTPGMSHELGRTIDLGQAGDRK